MAPWRLYTPSRSTPQCLRAYWQRVDNTWMRENQWRMSPCVEHLTIQLSVARAFARYAPMEALARAQYVAAEARGELAGAMDRERVELLALGDAAARSATGYAAALKREQEEARARERAHRERELRALDAALPPRLRS